MSLSLKKVAKLKCKIYMGLFIHCYHHPMCWLREGAERETSRKNITRFVSVKTQRITIFIIILAIIIVITIIFIITRFVSVKTQFFVSVKTQRITIFIITALNQRQLSRTNNDDFRRHCHKHTHTQTCAIKHTWAMAKGYDAVHAHTNTHYLYYNMSGDWPIKHCSKDACHCARCSCSFA